MLASADMTRPQPAQSLTVEFERAALRAVGEAYDEFNSDCFAGRLRRPTLMLGDHEQCVGLWRPTDRSLSLARSLLVDQGWGVVLEVLKHEMAHQYVDEVLQIVDEGPHGATFRQVCGDRGIDPAAHGLDSGQIRSHVRSRDIDRIVKLLSLAERAELHEAQAAMGAAQRLMLKHNIDHCPSQGDIDYGFRHLGRPTGRVGEADRILAAILGEFFFVEVIWVPVYRVLEAKRASILEVCGTSDNLEMAGFVHGFLSETADRLWMSYREQQKLSGNRLRREFRAGVMTGFRDKLKREQRRQAIQGLVWVADSALRGYVKQRHPRVRWVYASARRRPDAWAHGREKGMDIVLGRPLKSPAADAPRLLSGRRF